MDHNESNQTASGAPEREGILPADAAPETERAAQAAEAPETEPERRDAEAEETEETEEIEESAQKAVLRKFWQSTNYLLVPMVAVFLLLGVFFSLAYVPSGSMEPTLPTKSHFIGWRLPYFLGDPVPERGDIVMFRSEELDELLVKRVIGLPGDVITFQDGDVYVNGALLEEPYLDWEHRHITEATGELSVFEVPEDSVFVLGDNRDSSFDSRRWNNPYIHVRKIRSKAIVDVAVLPECTWRGVRLVS